MGADGRLPGFRPWTFDTAWGFVRQRSQCCPGIRSAPPGRCLLLRPVRGVKGAFNWLRANSNAPTVSASRQATPFALRRSRSLACSNVARPYASLHALLGLGRRGGSAAVRGEIDGADCLFTLAGWR